MWKVNLKILVAFWVFMITLTVPSAEGKLITVDDDAPANFTSIQPAINYASKGDLIEVRPGTYYEAINFGGKAIRLYSSGGPEVTTIDGHLSQSFQDNFNDGDYTGWQIVDQGNYSTPSSWSAATGEMVQSSNIYTEPTSDQRYLGTYALCTQDLPWADYEVTLRMKALDDDWMGVMFRYVDPNNYYRFAWNGTVADRRLVKMENKAVTTLQQDNSTYVVDQWYQIRIAVQGDNLKVFVDDVKVFDYDDSSFSSGAIALYCWGNEGTYFDDIEVKWSALHVVQCVSGEDANTVLDGFTITGGNADGNWPHNYGGGMYNQLSSPMVTNCIFTGNSADIHGGGMYNVESSPTVINCAFYDNIASDGVGMCNLDNSSPTLTNCTFSGNSANYAGGGMYNWHYSSPTLTNCIFSNNTAEWYGGGMYNSDNSNPIVTNCSLIGNTADIAGGGMYNESSSPTVTNCTFSGNSAQFSTGEGGGMYNNNGSSPTVTNCIFWKNEAKWGGGMCNFINSSPTLTNCTFSNNICSNGGGGIFNSDNSNPTVTNCILWGNAVFQIMDWDSPASTTTVSFSDVQGGWPGVVVIDSDPLFVDAAGGDLRLSSSASLCVDTGAISTPGLPATDLAGNPRVVDGDRNGTVIVDMGAYEFQAWQIHNITQDIWYETIQLAINDANNGDEIEVSPGTYNEAIDFGGKAIRLYSSGGQDVTTIDANGLNSSVVTCNSGEDANTILEGFTITGGNADSGGGMYNNSSSPTVTNCNFTTNSVTGDGGGMYNDSSSPTLTDCTFNGNSAGNAGGGMHNHQSNPAVTNCTFEDNEADAAGGMANYTESSPILTNCTFRNNSARAAGGMNNYVNSSPTLTNCIFTGNIANQDTGGMHNHSGSNAILTNCIFIYNSAGNAGGGLQNAYSTTTLTNCTFIGNTAVTDGGGIRNWDSSPTVTNCILWDNEPNEISSGGTSAPVVNYSDIRGGHTGTGNINTDPNFVDANNPDPNLVNLRLLPGSACIDAGDTIAVPSGIFVDLDGNPRGLDDPASPDMGVSVLGVTVDMGAYEFHPCPIAGDINCDGVVDFKDVAMLCNNWLAGIGPEL